MREVRGVLFTCESSTFIWDSLASLARSSGSAVCQALYGPIFANNKSTFKKVAFFARQEAPRVSSCLMGWGRSARDDQWVTLLSRRSVSRQVPVKKVR
jgi:hypothetical protein